MAVRRLALTLPIGLAVAALAHSIRFGDEHAFGEEHHDWVTALLQFGLALLASAIVARTAAVLGSCADGSIVAERLADLLPGRARPFPLAAAVCAAATSIYVGIELLETEGDRNFTFALLTIALFSCVAAFAIRALLGLIGRGTIALLRAVEMARTRAKRPSRLRERDARPTTRRNWAAVRLGRAPPLFA